ncbi:hypothetical protein [Maribellus sediminis]|uniref:hypothetical protein n=1 Tax=Maribellus sediminis TaxID=2696285 RepID=UPI00143162A3|nr:hypothetical protein [Maribellus sediminis]
MEINKYLLIILIFTNIACSSTLNITEIQDLTKTRFDSLSIQPAIELYGLRIDIIRQTKEEQVNDSTILEEAVSYNFLGFNLGNGLFYDLNDNLSLRVDYLLDVDPGNDFEVAKIYSKKKRNKTYKSQNGKFSIGYRHNKKAYDKFQVENFNDSLCISYGKKLRYSIAMTDSLTKLTRSDRVLDEIQMKDKNFYYQKFSKRVDEYKLLDKTIILDDKYKITQNENGDIIQIYKISKKGDYLRFRIIQDDRNIFIYNDKFSGKKIIKDNNKFTFYYNDLIGYEFKVIN